MYVSLILDVTLSGTAATSSSLLIILRLWRLGRIVHGIVHAATAKANKRVQRYRGYKRQVLQLMQENATLKDKIAKLERDVKELKKKRGRA